MTGDCRGWGGRLDLNPCEFQPRVHRPVPAKPKPALPTVPTTPVRKAFPPAKASPAKAPPTKALSTKAAPDKATKAPKPAKAVKVARMKPAEREAFFARLAERLPEPQTELEYSNPYTLLVAVVLSAQATDVGVNKATRGLFAAADHPAAMVALGEAAVRDHVKTIGLFRTKAANVIRLSEILLAEHGGQVPRSRAALEALPGVGRKTANVVLNVAFGEPTIAVDTHIFRVSNRTGLAPGKDVLAVELALEKAVPAAYRLHAHHWLILHGRYVCKARKPDCAVCTVADLCRYPAKTTLAGMDAAEEPANLEPEPA
ncbi:MAG: endonuclease [Pseudomonadota bacterium]